MSEWITNGQTINDISNAKDAEIDKLRAELVRTKRALNEQMEKWNNVVTRSHGVLNFDSREGLTEWWWFFATGLLDVPANLVSREG